MEKIDIVLPDGSMQKKVGDLFARAGIPISVKNARKNEGRTEAEWIGKVMFQRPQEIPHYLKARHFDVAIVGEDWIANWGFEFPTLLSLPIGRGSDKPVKIVIAVSKDSGIATIDDLPLGAEIATEYVQLTERYFRAHGWADARKHMDIKILPSYGNTEHKILFGANAIVDVTESGRSLDENGLVPIATIMESNTVIVANHKSYFDEGKRETMECFKRLIDGAYKASLYVLMKANVNEGVLDRACELLGGLKGPTCARLAHAAGWYALEAFVLKEKELQVKMELLDIGVTDIAVMRDIPLIMS